jgi:hypothetical protein
MPSNHGQPNVPLTNIDVLERVARFMRTGDVCHLPPALRGEADSIVAMCVAGLVVAVQPWPAGAAGAAGPEPGPGASMGEIVRALTGDERADADSGLFDDAGPEAE